MFLCLPPRRLVRRTTPAQPGRPAGGPWRIRLVICGDLLVLLDVPSLYGSFQAGADSFVMAAVGGVDRPARKVKGHAAPGRCDPFATAAHAGAGPRRARAGTEAEGTGVSPPSGRRRVIVKCWIRRFAPPQQHRQRLALLASHAPSGGSRSPSLNLVASPSFPEHARYQRGVRSMTSPPPAPSPATATTGTLRGSRRSGRPTCPRTAAAPGGLSGCADRPLQRPPPRRVLTARAEDTAQ